jgi:hypothetical protein
MLNEVQHKKILLSAYSICYVIFIIRLYEIPIQSLFIYLRF